MNTAPINPFYREPDAAVLARARLGDRVAVAALYEQYSRACYNLAIRVTGESAAAEDVVHDVFVRLVAALAGFRGEAPFGAWLRRLIANSAVDVLRRRRWLDLEGGSQMLDSLPSEGGLPEQQVLAWQLLQRLSPKVRLILVLHELEGWTHAELGVLFGQSESYSKSILARGLQGLRADLASVQKADCDERC